MSDVISKGKKVFMDIGENVAGVGKEVVSKENAKETFTKSNLEQIVYVAGGMAFGTLVSGAIIKYIPFSRMGTVGRGLRGLTTMTVGSGILMYGQKKAQGNYAPAFTVGGGTMAVIGFLDLVGITGMFSGVANVVRGAEE